MDKNLQEKKNWIKDAIKKPGALKATAKEVGAVKGGKIKKGWVKSKAKESGKTGRRARLALTLGKLRKEGYENLSDRVLEVLLKECNEMQHTNTKVHPKLKEREVGLKKAKKLKECAECEEHNEKSEVAITDENEAAIKDYIKANPELDDAAFHEFCQNRGIDPNEAEEVVYKWANELAKEEEQESLDSNTVNESKTYKELYTEFLQENYQPKKIINY